MASAPEKAVVQPSSGPLDGVDWPPASFRLRVAEDIARRDDALALLQPMQGRDARANAIAQSWQPSCWEQGRHQRPR
jgi:hypothetical protein